ncbi:hypothetical protein CNYM01_10620 [Colletotrichum nymphaeae SA-01]|uniref:BTB domain-containing protein n=1 Tax=Colletotrichum nymphaeae SA-01 TaxID=1460502 RepID=A0A135RZ56_9PEZI|nr:hypothetical protein CNYM01_10620 [Colletotrichum nymphaeae SA-01]
MIRPMLDMRKILNSPQIEYHVGDSGKSFSVPKAVMEFLSPNLVRMPPSGQGQPSSASITLRDIDEATFTRLVEYAYRQDYTVQGLKARSSASDEVSVLPSLYDKLERGDEYSESNPFIHDSGMDILRELKGSYIMLDKSIHKEALEAKRTSANHIADCAPGNEICNIILEYFVATLPTSRHHPRFRDTLVQDEAFTRQLLDKLPNVAPPIND